MLSHFLRKTKRLNLVFLLGIFSLSFLLMFITVPKVKGDITTTLTFYSSTSDGFTYMQNSGYTTAHNSATGFVGADPSYLKIGQNNYSQYDIDRAFLFFDTSSIPSSATINNATLGIYIISNDTDTDFNVTIQTGTIAHPSQPVQTSDYYYAWYSGDGGSRNTTEISSLNAYWNITLNTDGLGYIDTDGTTSLVLRSSTDINSIPPIPNFQDIVIGSRERGIDYVSKLYVTYTVTSSELYTYNLHGPYYDDGTIVNGNVNVTAFWPNGEITSYILNSTGSEADSQTILSGNALVQLLWNASSALNFTRVFDFTGETYYDLNIYIPKTSEVATGQYAFSIIDFYGMTNPFIQTSIFNGTETNLVESRDLNISSTVYFTMEQYRTYQLTVICDQGTYTQQFLAENTFSMNIPILAGNFPITNSTIPTVVATRYNSSAIAILYSDSSESTFWFYALITHTDGGTTVEDYAYNLTGNSQSLVWNDADSEKTYLVNASAYVGTTIYHWLIPISTEVVSNPWLGLFDFLGQNTNTTPHYYTGWPQNMSSAQIAQLVGAGIITLFLGIGSFRNAGASCIMAWIIGGIMFAIGWWNGGVSQAGLSALPEFGLAGFLAILIAMHESKQQGAGLS